MACGLAGQGRRHGRVPHRRGRGRHRRRRRRLSGGAGRAAGHPGQSARRDRSHRWTGPDPGAVAMAPVARPGNRAQGADRLTGAGRRRRTFARLSTANPRADPEARSRAPRGGPAGAQSRTRLAGLALHRSSRRRDVIRRGAEQGGRRDRGRARRARRGRHRRRRRDQQPRAGIAERRREAAVNAAKHSGAAKVDIFAEVDGSDIELFVRDRGSGFDRIPSPTTGSVCDARSSTGWSGMAARRRSARPSARAPKCACRPGGHR